MRKRLWTKIIICIAVLLCACGETAPAKPSASSNPAATYAPTPAEPESGGTGTPSVAPLEFETVEDYLAYMETEYGFSREEMEGYDIPKFVEDHKLYESDYTAEEVHELFESELDWYRGQSAFGLLPVE